MGGRTIKYPTRRKFVPPNPKTEEIEKKELSKEEHEERLRKLKEIGLLK
jgi:hypothetical protein